jgi:uncharacterized membrane protein
MNMPMSIAIAFHILAAVIWVGGMFFAYMALRPAAGALDPMVRLALWRRTFAKFFPWVWAAVAVLLASGYYMLFAVFGGFAGAGWHIHVMHLIGWVMILLYGHVYFAPYKQLIRGVESEDPAEAKQGLDRIRQIVAINTVLGLANAVVGAAGRYWY